MGSAMRGHHSDSDHIGVQNISDTEVKLTCTDGWEYIAHPSYVEAVIDRHKQEKFLPK